MDQKFKTHNRQSYRLQDYDYSCPGLYFVTIVSYKRLPIFSEIVAGEIQLSQIGKIVEGSWKDISLHFPDVSVEAYVIMPNHLHGIVKINEKRNVGATHEVSSLRRQASPYSTNDQNTNPKGPPPQTLSAIIGSFKSAATKRIHKMGLNKEKTIWQRNYYEHIIRDEDDYHRIIEYIRINPFQWENDQEYVTCSVFDQ